ncbi:nitrite reductase (NADH) large subunit [Arthrobacter sp. Hiyo8]|nr:nitrite reductase (NADH) large subunit [Arthrobacter sp. Hiyo8]
MAAGSIRDAVNACGTCEGKEPVHDVPGLKACTRAGTQCGSCVPMIKKLLEGELKKSGIEVSKALCEHFELSRQELFDAIRVLELTSFEDILAKYGTGAGCDICKPTIASILASQHSAYVLDAGRGTLQDTNDRALANMQKDGTYSVVPRIPGGRLHRTSSWSSGRSPRSTASTRRSPVGSGSTCSGPPRTAPGDLGRAH